MMKMKVVMDEDRIAKEDKYDLMKIYSYLDRLFQKRGMTREEGWYINGTLSRKKRNLSINGLFR